MTTVLRGYQSTWLRADLVAGLTVWAVLVPESLAYATIAGVPPVVGLYAAVPALVIYALLGSSRHLVVGPMSASAALSAGIVGTFVAAGSDDYVTMTAALAVVTGLLALVAGLLRLGFVASFISEPVLKGFIVGLALTIIIGQVPKLLGIEGGEGNFFEKLWHVVRNLGDIEWRTLVVGLASLAVVLSIRRWLPLVPGSLVAVLLGIAAVTLLDLDDEGVAIVGHIEAGLPSVGVPDAPLTDYLVLVGPAVGLLLIAFAEGLAAAKTYAARAGYEIDANRELIGLGGANIGAGLSSGMVVNGSLSKTAVNGSAGARTQLSGLTVAVLTLVTLLFLTSLFENLPEATLAAVVIAAVIELVDIEALRRLYRVWSGPLGGLQTVTARADFYAALAALLGVLLFDTLPGLIIGIVASLVLLLARTARPHVARLVRVSTSDGGGAWADVARHPGLTPDDDIVVLRVESSLFFANADHVRDVVRHACTPGTRAVILDGETMPSVDVTAAQMLSQLARDLERDGIRLLLVRGVGQVRDVIRRAGEEEPVVVLRGTVDDAVAASRAAPDGSGGAGST